MKTPFLFFMSIAGNYTQAYIVMKMTCILYVLEQETVLAKKLGL